MTRKLVYACDYRGIELRKILVKNHNLIDFEAEDLGIDDGSTLDYIDISRILAERLRNTNDIGVMICGSGQGVAIVLNRFIHIRAVVARSIEDSIQTRQKLNANVVCLGSKYSSFEESQNIIETIENFENI